MEKYSFCYLAKKLIKVKTKYTVAPIYERKKKKETFWKNAHQCEFTIISSRK